MWQGLEIFVTATAGEGWGVDVIQRVEAEDAVNILKRTGQPSE